MIELVIKVGFFEICDAFNEALRLLMAVFEHKVLRLLHLLHLHHLLLQLLHRVLGQVLLEFSHACFQRRYRTRYIGVHLRELLVRIRLEVAQLLLYHIEEGIVFGDQRS